MTSKLTGTVALVTGASSGIGEATARRLAQDGACVALVARRLDRLEALAAEIEQAGGTALAVEADISERTQVECAVQQSVERFGRLDILVNNAGLMLLGPVVGADPDDWDRMIAINAQGLLYATHAALPYLLKAAEDGHRQVADIVNIGSVAGRVAWNGYGVYNMTKFGVNGFTEALRQEVTKRHVRVGVLEPGGVTTELGSHNTGSVREEIDEFYATTEALAPRGHCRRHRLHGHPTPPRLHRRALDHAYRPGLIKTSRTVLRSGSTQRAGTQSTPSGSCHDVSSARDVPIWLLPVKVVGWRAFSSLIFRRRATGRSCKRGWIAPRWGERLRR
jgi:NADP-dependent 3-hydroxy acid dehydrogenase YdfG